MNPLSFALNIVLVQLGRNKLFSFAALRLRVKQNPFESYAKPRRTVSRSQIMTHMRNIRGHLVSLF